MGLTPIPSMNSKTSVSEAVKHINKITRPYYED